MQKEISSSKQDKTTEQIIRIPLNELHPFPNHPYGIREDQAMQDTVDSVKQNGVVVPAIVRPRVEGGYEIVAGHRRKLASERAGFTDMPCIVRNLTDDEAIIQLVDSNAQREDVLPSERAKAYKMRLEAIKRTAGRPPRQAQENVPNNSANFRSDDDVGNVDGISGDTVRNIISLNNLVPELMQMVDDTTPARPSREEGGGLRFLRSPRPGDRSVCPGSGSSAEPYARCANRRPSFKAGPSNRRICGRAD